MFAVTNPVQLSLFEEATLAASGLSDEEILIALCQSLLEDASARPPVDLRVLASLRGITRIVESDQPWAGQVGLEADRLVVRSAELTHLLASGSASGTR